MFINSRLEIFLLALLLCASAVAGQENAASADTSSDQSYCANAYPCLDLPLAQLVECIPELRTVQPAPDQQELSMILQKMGRSVDDFVRAIDNLAR